MYKSMCWTRNFDGVKSGEVDATIAATQMMLAAHDLGLGTCWIVFFDSEGLRKAYNLPEIIVPIAILPIGYPAEDAAPAENHSIREPIESFLL